MNGTEIKLDGIAERSSIHSAVAAEMHRDSETGLAKRATTAVKGTLELGAIPPGVCLVPGLADALRSLP